jgi:hypothetical protein
MSMSKSLRHKLALATAPVAWSLFLGAYQWPDSRLDATQLPARSFSVQEYGAVGNSSRVSTQGSMIGGSTTLDCPDCSFSDVDLGKRVYVYGASGAPYALSLSTTIRGVLSPSSVTLAAPATQSTSDALLQIVGSDETSAILAARDAACAAAKPSAPTELLFPMHGVYALDRPLEPCSNLQLAGPGTILQTTILVGRAAGQGSSVIVFPRSPTGRWCSGGTMSAGSNVLRYGSQGDRPCNFAPADVSSPIVVQYAGQSYLPLYATISEYVSGSQVVLDQPAQTAVPVTSSGFDKVGTFIQIGTTPIASVEIHDLTLMNVATSYPPGRTLGVGIIFLGADPSSIKQNIRVRNLTIITASNNCLGGNNGFLDQYSFRDNTLVGCADASMYISGWNSRGIVANNTIKNFKFPGLTPQAIARVLQMGILVKNASNVTFTNNVIQLNTGEAGIMFGDHPQFHVQVQGNKVTVAAPNHNAVVGIGGNTGNHLLLTGNEIECQAPGKGIWFYSRAVSDIEVTGNVIRQCTAAIKFDGTGGGVGPVALKVSNNQITGCRDGIRFENVGGVNVVSNNKLSGCSGLPWLVVGSQNGSITYFTDDNATDNQNIAPRNFDNSVRQLQKGTLPPQ